jgi:drug/metabolite transporter (DMT)-like permease
MTRKYLIIGSFAAIYVLWGSTYFAIALGLKTIPPFLLMALRSFCGGVILTALNGRGIAKVSTKTWSNAALCGVLFFVGCHGVLAYAQQMVPSGVAAIVLATIPFWILLIDVLFPQGERPAPFILLGLVPGFIGVAIVAWQNVGQDGLSFVPILWLLAAACSWSVGTLLSRRKSDDAPSTLVSGMQLVIGGALLFSISWLTGEWQGFSLREVSSSSLEATAYLIMAGSVVGFAAYHWLLANVSTSLVATYTFINPIIAVFLGVLVLGEPFSGAMLLGSCLVLLSVAGIWATEHFAHTPQQQVSPSRAGAKGVDLRLTARRST